MTEMSLIAVPELQAEGPARLRAGRQGWCDIQFLRSGAHMTIEQHAVMRYVLLPGTSVEWQTADGRGQGRVSALAQQAAKANDQLLRYRVTLPDGSDATIDESHITRVHLPSEAGEQLAEVAFHDLAVTTSKSGKPQPPIPWGPQTLCAREEVLAWADSLWQASGGVMALSGARIDLLPHQIVTASKALRDAQVRYLLADEVGLGKTIEAGLIMQSLLAINPGMRVLVVAPGALVGQWFLELFVKFGGRRFTMLDGERIARAKAPWDEQLVICSARALEDLSPRDALRFATSDWDMVIMDECHRMQPGGILYQRLAVLSKKTPHVLLLSATPPRQHADAYLALLHLLQPDSYPLDNPQAFRDKLARSSQVAQLIRSCERDPEQARDWASEHLSHDHHLAELLAQEDYTQAVAWLREAYLPDHRVIRHRRRALQRLAADTGITPLALGERTGKYCDYQSDKSEQAVRAAAGTYRQLLLAPYNGDGTRVPPRLLHWLLQVDTALSAHPLQLQRLLAMRQAVVEDPGAFAEYRERASTGESLAAVLRSDLSESEAATQIAISAASHIADAAAEQQALEALQQVTANWAKKVPQRLRALLKSLREFWQDHPQEKVLLFTNHALSLQALHSYLADEVGANRVEDFGAHQDAETREAAAARFRNVDDCWVLVCDALGGEGRNFQFVSMVVHYDMPWSLSGIEQRIGRVDRLGRDGEVISLVCRCLDDDAIDGAWVDTVDQAMDVFAHSSSGLEFITASVEEQALRATVGGGAQGLRQQLPALCALVEAERQQLQTEEDESFGEDAGQFRAAQTIAEQLRRIPTPIGPLCRWLRGMGGQARSDEGPRAEFQLRLRASSEAERGVFAADRAQQQPALAFFARGHQIIDQLIDDAAGATWCQASAWRRVPAENRQKWEGLRCRLRLQLAIQPIIEAGLPLEILRRAWMVIPPAPDHLSMGFDGAVVRDQTLDAHLARPFSQRHGDRVLSNRVSRSLWMQPLVAGKGEQMKAWQQRVRQSYAAAQQQAAALSSDYLSGAQAALDQLLSSQHQVLSGRLQAAQGLLGAHHPDCSRLAEEVSADERQAKALRAALAGAEITISSCAYIKVA